MTTRKWPMAPSAQQLPLAPALLAAALGLSTALLVVSVPGNLQLLVVLIGMFFVVATLLNAVWGLLGLVLINYTNLTDVAIKYHGAPTFVQEAFVALIVLAILVRWVSKGERPDGWQLPLVLIAAYTLTGLLSVFYAYASDTALEQALSYVKFPIITLLVVVLLNRARYLRYVIWALLLTGVMLGTISTVQYLTGTYSNPYWGFARPPIIDVDDFGNSIERLAGPIGDPNFFAQVMLVLVPLAVDRMLRETSVVLRVLAAYTLVVCLITIAGTLSRGAYLGLFAVIVLLLWRYPPKPIVWALLLVAAVVAVPMIPEKYNERLWSLADNIPGVQGTGPKENDPSLRGRTSEALAALMMFRDYPLLGVGIGNYNVQYLRYSRRIGIDPRPQNRSAHSLYLEIAAERGLLGLTIFGAITVVMFRGLRRADRELTDAGLHNEAGMVYAFTAGMASYMLTSIFLHDAYPRYYWLLLGIALAMPIVAHNALLAARSIRREVAAQ